MRDQAAVVLLLVFVSSIFTGCATTPTDELARALEGTDCVPYVPPRGDRGPGSVFQLRDVAGKQIAYPVCQNLYPTDRSVSAGVSLIQQDKSTTYDASFTASLLAGLVKNIDSASASLTANNVRQVKVTWGPAEYRQLPSEQKFDAKGKVVPLSGNCGAALRQLKDTNQLRNVYVVEVALQVTSLRVTTDVSGNQGANVKVSLKKLLDLNPSVKLTEKDMRTLEVDAPRYVCAFPPVLVTDFVPSGLLAGESALIKGSAISKTEWQKLNAQ